MQLFFFCLAVSFPKAKTGLQLFSLELSQIQREPEKQYVLSGALKIFVLFYGKETHSFLEAKKSGSR